MIQPNRVVMECEGDVLAFHDANDRVILRVAANITGLGDHTDLDEFIDSFGGIAEFYQHCLERYRDRSRCR